MAININQLKSKPILFSILIILFILVIGKLINMLFLFVNYSIFIPKKLQSIFIYATLITLALFFIKKYNIPHSFFDTIKLTNYLYYLPALLSIYIFSIGFNDFVSLPDSFYSWKTILYGIKTFSQAFFEEILFRGIILGLLLNKYYDSKNGILKSVIISSLLFGFLHIINVWTQPNQIATINQIYATFCLGVLYASTYLKTRSIIILGFLHFGINFLGSIGNLGESGHVIATASQSGQTMVEMILTIILTLVIFGIPLLLGLLILKKPETKDIEKLMK